ncbi:MAG: hypothetical protein RDV48_27805 [Candidatus Eremiobacteraeota bacterium]|nr:hypothetical protein [Candidatus Eremiobacteraeota bacterium]
MEEHIGEDHAMVKYAPGNAGDILKHSWLIETVTWLLKECESPFLYADSFCGCCKYQGVQPAIRARLEISLRDSDLYRYQEDHLKKFCYLGSASLVQKVCRTHGVKCRIAVFDEEEAKIRSFPDDGDFVKLSLTDGYRILETPEHYHLILIDPYYDPVPMPEKLLPHLISGKRDSSKLVFIIHRAGDPSLYNTFVAKLKDVLRREEQRALMGRIPSHPYFEFDAKFHTEMLLVPAHSLQDKARRDLFPRLRGITLEQNRIIASETYMSEF